MPDYIAFNKGTIDKLPILDKRKKYYHNYLKGLHIDVRPSGQKSFRLNYKMGGYNYTYTIGDHPEITPAVAVDRARELKVSLSKGINPQQEKITKRKELTFKEFFFERYLEVQFSKKEILDVKPFYAKNKLGREVIKFEGKTSKKVNNLVETYNAHMHHASFSKKKMSDINYLDISSFLKTISSKSMHNRLIRELRAIFNTSDVIPNPVNRALKLDTVMKPLKARTIKLSNEDIMKLGKALDKISSGYMQDNGFFYQPQRIQAFIIEILALEGLRPDEVYSMKWTEIIDGIYKTETKTGYKEIPLTNQTMRILNSIERISPYIFPSPKDNKEHIQSVRKVWIKALELSGINPEYQLKDLRSTYSSRATQRFGLFDSSKLTNHSSTKVVEKHYSDLDSGERLARKNEIANEVEALLSGGGKVVKLG
jgi:integrase